MKKFQHVKAYGYALVCICVSVLFFSCKKGQFSSIAASNSIDNSTFAKRGLVFIVKDKHPGSIYALDATSGSVKWQYTIDSEPASFAPVPCIANNVLFAGIITYGNPEYSSFKTLLNAFNAHTGKLIWSTVLNKALGTITNPTFSNGSVFITSEKKLYSVNATNGKINWQIICDSGTSNNPLCSPTVINGTIYIGNKTHFFALDADDGSIEWKRKADLSYSSPTVANGLITFVDHADGYIKAFDTSGNIKWRFRKAGYIIGSTTANNNFIYQGTGYPFDSLNTFAVRSDNGGLKWNYAEGIDNSVDNSKCGDPFYADNTLYMALRDSLVAVSTTGAHNKKWSYFTGTPSDNNFSNSSPVEGGGIVYVMSLQKMLYAINKVSGAMIWQFNVGGENANYSPVILYNDGTAVHPTGSGMTQ